MLQAALKNNNNKKKQGTEGVAAAKEMSMDAVVSGSFSNTAWHFHI